MFGPVFKDEAVNEEFLKMESLLLRTTNLPWVTSHKGRSLNYTAEEALNLASMDHKG
jgi:hypothetical protein